MNRKLKLYQDGSGVFREWFTGSQVDEPKEKVRVFCSCLSWFETWIDDNGERNWVCLGKDFNPATH